MESEKPKEIPARLESLHEEEVRTDTVIATPDILLAEYDKSGLEKHAKAVRTAYTIARKVEEAGGRALFVGGTVRDMLLGKRVKDFDLEVYGLDYDIVEKIVKSAGDVKEVGRAFGILKITFGDDIDVDVAVPRADSKSGAGHKGVATKLNKHMSIKEAARRRDFTVNSLAADPLSGAVYDGYNGLADLHNGILRVTDKTLFCDDPLRAVRAMQFIARLGFSVDPESVPIIQAMAPRLKELPPERHFKEWAKLLLYAEKPSLGLAAGLALGILPEMHPEFLPLKDTPQEYAWHPEGDVWIHTLMAVDEAARIIRREQLNSDDALVVMLATLSHDLGKPATTAVEDGRIRSKAHEHAGAKPTKSFLDSIAIGPVMQEKILRIVENHLAPGVFYNQEALKGKKVSMGAIRKLALRIAPATIRDLALVGEADHLGRGPFEDPKTPNQLLLPLGEYPPGPWILSRARNLGVELSRPVDLLQGRDLIGIGYRPGRHFGEIIHLANRLRDENEYTREQVLSLMIDKKTPAEAISHLTQITGPAPDSTNPEDGASDQREVS